MFSIENCPIPSPSFLDQYRITGAYADCYCTDVAGEFAFSEFIFAFYTTPLFKLERWILRWSVSRPSTDEEARELAVGTRKTFAAWHVENRNERELLVCDMSGRTRSWLMSVTVDGSRTRLYFGSAVVPARNSKTGKSSLGYVFRSLLGFHRIYSALLLYFAARQLKRMSRASHVMEGNSR